MNVFGFKGKKNILLKTNFTFSILKLGCIHDSQLAKCKVKSAARTFVMGTEVSRKGNVKSEF